MTALYEHNTLFVHNSLSGEKEEFIPVNGPFVGMYVCGPTVYSDVHLGNCRTFISFDMMKRYLDHLGYKVRYVRNITDAGHLENDADEGEDKIAKKARLQQLEPMEIVQQYTVGFRKVMDLFNSNPPSIEPTATGHIIEQIEMVKDILDKGLAYEVNGSVYFDVEKYNESAHYGILSKRKIEDLISGTRVLDGQSEKRSPMDFALWKKASPFHIMRWPSPWGDGFPGWHLECSVMSTKYLGEEFDIHGGGMDLKFPHHECEIAQNHASTGKYSVKYWLHANMLTLNGQRMSKSTGNTILPEELFTGDNAILEKGFHPTVVRFFMMQAHYRSVLDFSNEALLASEKGYMRLTESMKQLESLSPSETTNGFDVEKWLKTSYEVMNDDFNTPMLIAQMFEASKFINAVADSKLTVSKEDLETLTKAMHAFYFDILGLQMQTEGDSGKLDAAMQVLIEMRMAARADKNWSLSDDIRDRLSANGIVLKDGKDGTTYSVE